MRVSALLLVASLSCACRTDIAELERIDAELSAELKQKAERAAALAEERRALEAAEQKARQAYGEAAVDELSRAPAAAKRWFGDMDVAAEDQGKDRMLRLSGKGGFKTALLALQSAAVEAPAVALRSLELKADGAWVAELLLENGAAAAPPPATPPPPDPILPPKPALASGDSDALRARIAEQLEERRRLDKLLQELDEIGRRKARFAAMAASRDGPGRLKALNPVLDALLSGDSPVLAEGALDVVDGALRVQGLPGRSLAPREAGGFAVVEEKSEAGRLFLLLRPAR